SGADIKRTKARGLLLTQSGQEPPLQGALLRRYDSAFGAVGTAMRRREFVTLVGSAAAWAVDAHAQQPERVRLVGVLQGLSANDPEGEGRFSAFQNALQQLGWTAGRNMRLDRRWGEGNSDIMRRQAAELVALSPDVIMTT